jgi:hypothetical protein
MSGAATAAGLALAAAISFGLCGVAQADVFEPIALASANNHEQADRGEDPAVSGNGRYVAFDGSFAGRSGVFRRDLATGQVETVAEAGAALPSISADGRYVSFTTTARLDEANDTNAAPDVYVRDMANTDSRPCRAEREEASEPCAFALASAVDGSQEGLSYTYSGDPTTEEPRYGSLAAGRSALSADGRIVAFVTTAGSNLSGPATAPLQVAVRDLATSRTQLVSVRSGSDEPVPLSEGGFGAVYPGGGQRPTFPGSAASAGASISADGSTVVWMGQEIEQQAPVLASEPHMEARYAEPLWRRIDSGLGAATRRVTGGGDPANPACSQSGEVAPAFPPTLSDPCQGPLNTTFEIGGVWSLGSSPADVPRLSADGRTVVFASNAPEVANGELATTTNFANDLYVVNMADGYTRVQALRRLTQVAGGNASEPQRVDPIVDFGVSPDGSEIAFTTARTIFPLGSPTYVSPPSGVAGAQELFDVDLANDTLTRVSAGFEGGASEPAAARTGSPSFSGDGNTLAFASSAYNLVYGDGNGASDAFVVARKRFGSGGVSQYISAPPPNPAIQLAWLLGASARSRADGAVVLEAQVPGVGSLRATAASALRIRRCVTAHGSCRRTRSTVATRTVAARTARSSAAGLLSVVLELGSRYRSLAARRGGLFGYVNVSFAAPGHATLRRRVAVTFRRTRKPASRTAGSTTRKHAGAGR